MARGLRGLFYSDSCVHVTDGYQGRGPGATLGRLQLRGIYRVFSNVPVLPGADLLGPLGPSFFLLSEMDDISPSLALDVGLRNVQDVDYKLPWSVSGSHCPHLMNIDQQHPPRSA